MPASVVRRAPLPELHPESNGRPLFPLEALSDLRLDVEVPLGEVVVTLNDLLRLSNGRILRLARLPEEPLEILVNGTPIARGEVRVHGERFAMRITEILRAPRRDGLPATEVPRAEGASR